MKVLQEGSAMRLQPVHALNAIGADTWFVSMNLRLHTPQRLKAAQTVSGLVHESQAWLEGEAIPLCEAPTVT
jgi:hypothetical protein